MYILCYRLYTTSTCDSDVLEFKLMNRDQCMTDKNTQFTCKGTEQFTYTYPIAGCSGIPTVSLQDIPKACIPIGSLQNTNDENDYYAFNTELHQSGLFEMNTCWINSASRFHITTILDPFWLVLSSIVWLFLTHIPI